MPDDPQSRFETDLALDPRLDSPAREGLTGTTRSDVYEPRRELEDDRLAGGPVRRAPRLRQVSRAHQWCVRGRSGLGRGAEPAAQAPPATVAKADRVALGGRARIRDGVRLSRRSRSVSPDPDTRGRARRLQPEVHAPVLRRRAPARGGRAALPLSRGLLRARCRPSSSRSRVTTSTRSR